MKRFGGGALSDPLSTLSLARVKASLIERLDIYKKAIEFLTAYTRASDNVDKIPRSGSLWRL